MKLVYFVGVNNFRLIYSFSVDYYYYYFSFAGWQGKDMLNFIL